MARVSEEVGRLLYGLREDRDEIGRRALQRIASPDCDFSRTFKAHYGYSPTDYQNAAHRGPAT
jgi:hypothetical protein